MTLTFLLFGCCNPVLQIVFSVILGKPIPRYSCAFLYCEVHGNLAIYLSSKYIGAP